ncbi:hypothetical protein [Cupriavidus basilensis]|uniref:hypothetical protein n=1 Tax=Cupriavidus basilensis TaxID=68895 RepID=UPI0020C700C4|nr:hypothetical protein [Cupriavidus basilensis]
MIIGASLSYSTDDMTLVEQADCVIEELEDWVMMLDRMLAALRPLQELQSKEDDSL